MAGAAKALLGKAALLDELPWVTGSLMTECDTLLMIGSGFLYAEFLSRYFFHYLNKRR